MHFDAHSSRAANPYHHLTDNKIKNPRPVILSRALFGMVHAANGHGAAGMEKLWHCDFGMYDSNKQIQRLGQLRLGDGKPPQSCSLAKLMVQIWCDERAMMPTTGGLGEADAKLKRTGTERA